MNLRDWFQLFRAQTAPATILLILVPYLTNAPLLSIQTLILFLFALVVHWISFGHNSLMDTAMGYDAKDPSKSHHPLAAGRISMTVAHNVIHWSLSLLALVAIILSLTVSPVPLLAVISIFIWYVFGYAYNSGLSKESLFGFLPISICFTAMGAWGWFLSHNSLNETGWILLAYFFMTILFQISWSGHLKELQMKERSNIIMKMGAKLEDDQFIPGYSVIYGGVVKFINVPILGTFLLAENFNTLRLVWLVFAIILVSYLIIQLIKPRLYSREKELKNMSLMEIVTIFTPVPLVLPWPIATVLMIFGILYFWSMNKLLWGVATHPRV